MPKEEIKDIGPDLAARRNAIIFGVVFLLVWPTFNLIVIYVVMLQLGYLELQAIGNVALRLYPSFALAYAMILLLQRLFPIALAQEKFWSQLALHVVVIFGGGQLFGPVMTETRVADLPQPTVIPIAYIMFQITAYVLVKTLVLQRERHFATELNLRQARINLLRSQTNPHFLFNTLNLLASEIKRDPESAQDIVYDLADLLRESMRAAESEFITLEEELRLATLYLTLQKKRFPGRLDFKLEIEDGCGPTTVPSLLLQPVVENVIKHVVAQSSDMTTLSIRVHTTPGSLILQVQDNGPQTDSRSIKPQGGLRIVRETLALHYHGQANMTFESTPEGGEVSISLPLNETSQGD